MADSLDIVQIDLQASNVGIVEGTERDIYAVWSLKEKDKKDHLDHIDSFKIEWQYYTGDKTRTKSNIWFEGNTSTITVAKPYPVPVSWSNIYSAPENAKIVRVRVTPESKDKPKQKDKKTAKKCFKGQPSAFVVFYGLPGPGLEPPEAPQNLSLTISSGLRLTAECTVSDEEVQFVEFQVIKDNKDEFFSHVVRTVYTRAAVACDVEVGGKYKVRARASLTSGNSVTNNTPASKADAIINYELEKILGGDPSGAVNERGICGDFDLAPLVSDWTDFTENVQTRPGKVKDPIELSVTDVSTTSGNAKAVKVQWKKAVGATGYTIQYTTDKDFFVHSPENVQSVSVGDVTYVDIIGLELGIKWWFRVCATNSEGESPYCKAVSTMFGTAPTAPTTWTLTSTATVGSTLRLYWTHNSSDGSSQKSAQVEVKWIRSGGSTVTNTYTVSGSRNYYDIDTGSQDGAVIPWGAQISGVSDGDTIEWKVKTRGIIDEYGPWSSSKSVELYYPATITSVFSYGTSESGNNQSAIFLLRQYPFNIRLTGGPNNRSVISFSVSIVSGETYTDIDETGMEYSVSGGEEIYYGTFGPNVSSNVGSIQLFPSDVDFMENVQYAVNMTVVMSNGLRATASRIIKVNLQDFVQIYRCDAEIDVMGDYTASIIPRAYDSSGNPKESQFLDISVYRREYNGKFTTIAKDINTLNGAVTVVDPHPSLNYARYRIVAISNRSGAVSFADVERKIGINSIIIQWDEQWTPFNSSDSATKSWSGSLLELPYNVDITAEQKNDVELVKYIGREHPVSYYGTMRNETGHWKSEILKTDARRLYLIRRLANFMGDVYVREPSGLGYWAQVDVSYNIDHGKATIPVTFSVTRVDGGI